jgi:hypothetical protein
VMITIWLICDVSGSMIEAGKRLVVRGLVRQVEQYGRLGYTAAVDLKLVAWHAEARHIPWVLGDEVPNDIFECRRSADGAALVQLLSSPGPGDRFIFFTDGFWSDETQVAIKNWKAKLDPKALRVIKIGADANPKLKGDDVFESEAFFAAMDGWLPL